MTIEQTGILKERANRLKVAKKVGEIVGGRFLLAGGALTKDDSPKDFDIYGVDRPLAIPNIEWRLLKSRGIGGYLSRTANAITTRIFGQVVQFCTYHKPTPQKTVEAFDFAHCMAGAVFSASGEVMEVVATPDFWQSEKAGTTWYTGSEYPLSSLMRCMKFHKRGLFGEEDHKPAALQILYDIVERGFKDCDDFQDQCASISESFRCVEANDLFDLLVKKGGGEEKSSAVVNAAKLYDALKVVNKTADELLKWVWNHYQELNYMGGRLKRAVEGVIAAPPRNCDRFGGDIDKLREAYLRERGLNPEENFPDVFPDWLLAPSTERKGGAL